MPFGNIDLSAPSPADVQQAQYAAASNQALGMAKLDPFQRANYLMGMAGAGLAAPVAGMLGLHNAALDQA